MERYRIHNDAHVYFVTFSIVEWLPVFVTEKTFRIVSESFNFCHQRKNLRIHAYVIMPTHLHAIVFDAEWNSERLEQTLTDFRKFTGRQLTDWCLHHGPQCFAETLAANAPADREHRFWQPSRHPETIESEPFWRQKLDYLHENPCRKGLVRRAVEWRFSSASWHISDCSVENDVLLTPLNWT